jgi:hypothetical protein
MLIKVALKLNFIFISSVRNVSYHLKNEVFDIFCISILKNCSRRMKQKNVANSAKNRPNLWEFN